MFKFWRKRGFGYSLGDFFHKLICSSRSFALVILVLYLGQPGIDKNDFATTYLHTIGHVWFSQLSTFISSRNVSLPKVLSEKRKSLKKLNLKTCRVSVNSKQSPSNCKLHLNNRQFFLLRRARIVKIPHTYIHTYIHTYVVIPTEGSFAFQLRGYFYGTT
jgi:hypothetical protein